VIRRRKLMQGSGALALGATPLTALAETVTLPFENGERPIVQVPGKRPMIRLTSRPPQLETPFSVFNENVITPNDAFFVRYHLASVEVVAVNQCSGNSRGFSNPRVAGGQSGNGAMGNARWKGVPLKAVLDQAGVQAGAKQVVFNGIDRAVVDKTPDFVKALNLDHARDGEVMIAYQMNGADLPVLNGYPVRLVVPGYYGTYWMKHLNEITVIDSEFDGFWMKTAYRIPDTPDAMIEPGTAPKSTIPIGRFNVRSFITSVADGAKVKTGQITLKGIAFNGGSGIKQVDVSTDGGKTWAPAKLGQDLGKYSFREWSLPVSLAAGEHVLQVRATGNDGKTQPDKAGWNPAGYMRNVIESTRVTAA